MTKKLKIKDLEDDPNLPPQKTDEASAGKMSGKMSVDELSDHEEIKVPAPPKAKAPEVVQQLVYFKRSLFVSYFSKAVSTFLALLCLDLVSYLMSAMDGVNVRDLQNFHSIFLSGSTNMVICKISAFFILVYFLTTKKEIVVNQKGIYCTNVEITDILFFNSKNVFLTWNQIKKAKLKMRLFEPYLFFYDDKDLKLGHLEFSIASKKTFFDYIAKHAGADHPMNSAKSENFLF